MLTRAQYATIAAASVTTILLEINKAMPDAYMDEVFHEIQTKSYCRGDYKEWDPKITTFPGLYVLGAGWGKLVHGLELNSQWGLCSIGVLRTLNLLLAAACLPVFYAAASLVAPGRTEPQAALLAATCALLPTHAFFAFLYYTDVASALFTTAAYVAACRGRHAASAAASLAAVAVRQTNVVWVAFALGAGVLREAGVVGAVPGLGLAGEARTVLAWLQGRGVAAWAALRWSGHILLLAAFAAFLRLNGGVAVGDRNHHAPTLHAAQLCYAAAFACAAAAPALVPDAVATLAAAARRPTAAVAACLACAGVVAATARAHPFLLADNRHYTFYVWRRLLAPAPLLWAPAYALALGTLWRGLGRTNGALWRLGLLLAAALVLVPSPLIEPRYFTIPTLLVILHGPTPGRMAACAGLAAFLAVNAVTLFVMVRMPFVGADGSVARFMW